MFRECVERKVGKWVLRELSLEIDLSKVRRSGGPQNSELQEARGEVGD